MLSKLLPAAALGYAAFSTPAASAAVAALDVNLVHNGGAETGTGKSGSGRNTIPGWNDPGVVYGDTTVVSGATEAGYSANIQNYANAYSQAATQTYLGTTLSTTYGPVVSGQSIKGAGNLLGGTYFYAGNTTTGSWGLSQTIDLSNALTLLATIEGGNARFAIEGWFGGYGPSNAGDYGQFRATFYASTDGSGTALDSITIGPTGAINNTAMLYDSDTGVVPVGTQSITFTALFNRTFGGNDAAIDNLSFVISVPEPSSALLGGIAFAAALIRRRR